MLYRNAFKFKLIVYSLVHVRKYSCTIRSTKEQTFNKWEETSVQQNQGYIHYLVINNRYYIGM